MSLLLTDLLISKCSILSKVVFSIPDRSITHSIMLKGDQSNALSENVNGLRVISLSLATSCRITLS